MLGRDARDRLGEGRRVLAFKCRVQRPAVQVPVGFQVLREIAGDRRFGQDDDLGAVICRVFDQRCHFFPISLDIA